MGSRQVTGSAIAAELAAARAASHPGRARVCARRAAGAAIRLWRPDWPGDALKLLRRLQTEESVASEARDAARRLCARVNVDHTWPFDTDPIEDAERIISALAQNRMTEAP
jgi:hypothetical protein